MRPKKLSRILLLLRPSPFKFTFLALALGGSLIQSPLGIAAETSQPLAIKYKNPELNKNSKQAEDIKVYLREPASGKIVEVNLHETSANSGEFSGIYFVAWPRGEPVKPELYYVAPLAKGPTPSQVNALIKSKKIQRKPFVLHKDEKGQYVAEIFDSREAAQAALNAYKPNLPKNSNDKIIAAAVMESADLAKLKEEQKKQAVDTKHRVVERQELARLEKEKREQRMQKFSSLSESEKAAQKQMAAQFAEAALDLYRVNNFKEAEINFAKAMEHDPANVGYAYQYGITLFRNEKFNESIVDLDLLSGPGFDPVERDFYVAMSHHKLNEYDLALKDFDQIRKSKKQPLGASSAFYIGLIKFDQTRYEESKVFFQETLDTSEDPKLDERAEDYIEKIERIKAFAQNKAKRFILSLSSGLQYDSNILLTPDSNGQQSAPTNRGDTRFSGGVGLQWRAVYEKNYEFSLKGRTDAIYTYHSTFANADPILHSIGAPFVYKGLLFEKGYRLEAKPGYEVLYLDPNSTGTKTNYMNSPTLDLSNTFVMNDDWFSSLNFKYRNDQIPSSTDQSATKYNLDFNNIFFFNKKKTQGVILDTAYTQNAANGASFRYTRYDLGCTYLHPIGADAQFAGGVSYYRASYLSDPAGRADDDTTLLAMVSQPLNPWLSGNILGTYVFNNSTNPVNQYTKYTIGVNFSAEFQL